MSMPKAPELLPEQVEKEILAVLNSGKGFPYQAIWRAVIGIRFRNCADNNWKLNEALQSLVKTGRVASENGWYALRRAEDAQQGKITAFSR